MALSADGKTVAVGTPSNGSYGHVRVFRRKTEEVSSSWDRFGQVLYGTTPSGDFGSVVALSSDGLILAVGAEDAGSTRVFWYTGNASGWEQVGQDLHVAFVGCERVFALDLSSNGRMMAVVTRCSSGADVAGIFGLNKKGTNWDKVGNDITFESELSNSDMLWTADGRSVALAAPFVPGCLVCSCLRNLFILIPWNKLDDFMEQLRCDGSAWWSLLLTQPYCLP